MSEIDAIYRNERGRVLASLIRLLGSFDRAEEALHDAFLAAATQWPRDGVPKNPRAWLVSAGRFKAIDRLRQRARFDRAAAELARDLDAEENVQAEPQQIADDSLRLIFICCHPALPPDAQLALTLREVCGLTTEAIAAAFLARPAAIAQRIVRAKARIRDENLPFELPEPSALPDRLEIVLHAAYLIFNEGYSASRGEALLRPDLSAEAIRLTRLIAGLLPGPDVDGLLALMLLQEARRPARTSPDGGIVLMADQDRTLWDRSLIAEGQRLAASAFARPPVGAHTIEAMIALRHMEAADAPATDWASIVRLYDLLQRADPSPVVALNRAVAIAMRDGPAAGLALIDAILAKGELATYRFAHAARADFLRRLGRKAEARAAYQQALSLSEQAAEQSFLKMRIEDLG